MERLNKNPLIDLIQHTIPVSINTAADIAVHFEERTFVKNDLFLRENTVSNSYLFLESGIFRAYTIDHEGNDITTNFYTSNQMVFEVASFFTRSRSKENIQALTDSNGWEITYDTLNMLFHSIPEFREFGRAMLVKGFVSLKQRTLTLINETAEERYAHLIQSQPDIFKHAPLKYIATYLGITDSSLSRIRREYQKK